MKDKLTGRVGRIISGSLHALIDAVENAAPEAVMEQAIREIDDAVDEVRGELGTVIANKHMASSRLKQMTEKCDDLGDKISIAVDENRDDLAEVAIAQQLDVEAQLPVLDEQIQDLSAEEKKLEGYITALQAKKREMRDELRLFRETRKNTGDDSASGQTGANPKGGVASKVSKAESAFSRVMESTSGYGAPSSMPDKATAAAMNELEDMARKNRIKERLAAIKGQKG